MHDNDNDRTDAMSRREMLVGIGAIAGAGLAVAGMPSWAGAAAPRYAPAGSPEALSPTTPGLTYLNIDAQAFWPTELGGPGATPANQRIYADVGGSQPALVNSRIWAPLPLPVGSVVSQISAAYQNQPIIEISKRPLFNTGAPGTAPTQAFQKSFTVSPGGAFASTEVLPTPVMIQADATYTISVFCTAGTSIFGVSIGYLPPTQSFIGFTGPTPRVLDTREGGLTKFAVGEQRKIPLGLLGARSGVFNLTVVNTEGSVAGSPPGGFVSAFSGDTFPATPASTGTTPARSRPTW